MRKPIRSLASAFAALAFSLSAALAMVACSGDDGPAPGPVAVESVSVAPPTLNLKVGGAAGTLAATVLPEGASDKDVTWTVVPETGVAEVAGSGSGSGATATVTAVGNGTATVTVAAANGKKATCIVTVTTPATGVELDSNELTLNPGGSHCLKATVLPETASDKAVTWFSDREDIAAVENGLVTAVAVGAATITVATADGNKMDACQVTVAGQQTGVGAITRPTFFAGEGGSYFLKDNRTLWACGCDYNGELGVGTWGEDRHSYIQVGEATNWESVTGGDGWVLALKGDGSLWSWGYNAYGSLGDGLMWYNHNDVKPIGWNTGINEYDWAAISGGRYYALAIKANGSLWAWGQNNRGQLGINNTEDKDVPVRVGAENDWAVAFGGFDHSAAIKADGSLWMWGINSHGELGLGDDTNRSVPTRLGLGNDWAAVSMGEYYTMALKVDGTLWAWGDNWVGMLGLGDTERRYAPVQVGTDSNWVAVSAGYWHVVALKADGSLWAWGNNWFGQCGAGLEIEQFNSPVPVGADRDWAVLPARAAYHNLALKANGDLWAWGRNYYGQMGAGYTSEQVETPVLSASGVLPPAK
jgi:alpha-tubulin suppressor-like RCC1 family protein